MKQVLKSAAATAAMIAALGLTAASADDKERENRGGRERIERGDDLNRGGGDAARGQRGEENSGADRRGGDRQGEVRRAVEPRGVDTRGSGDDNRSNDGRGNGGRGNDARGADYRGNRDNDHNDRRNDRVGDDHRRDDDGRSGDGRSGDRQVDGSTYRGSTSTYRGSTYGGSAGSYRGRDDDHRRDDNRYDSRSDGRRYGSWDSDDNRRYSGGQPTRCTIDHDHRYHNANYYSYYPRDRYYNSDPRFSISLSFGDGGYYDRGGSYYNRPYYDQRGYRDYGRVVDRDVIRLRDYDADALLVEELYSGRRGSDLVCTVTARGPDARYVPYSTLRYVAERYCSRRADIRVYA